MIGILFISRANASFVLTPTMNKTAAAVIAAVPNEFEYSKSQIIPGVKDTENSDWRGGGCMKRMEEAKQKYYDVRIPEELSGRHCVQCIFLIFQITESQPVKLILIFNNISSQLPIKIFL